MPAAPVVHPLSKAFDTSVDGGVREASVPCGGTRSEVPTRRAGGIGGLATSRALSTGGLRKAAGVIIYTCLPVSAPSSVMAVGR